MGNTEVGHLNLGAGAVVRQDLARIDDAIADGSLAPERDAAGGARRRRAGAPARARLRRRRALLAGAPAGAGRAGARRWRSRTSWCTPSPTGATRCRTPGAGYLRELDAMPGARVGSVVGRYWAMDRDRRWDRTQRAYDLLVHGDAPAPRRERRAGRPRRLRPRRDRRVHRAHARRAAEATVIRPPGQRARVQLPPRPDAPDHARAGRAAASARTTRSCPAGRGGAARRRHALHDADALRGGLALPGAVRARAPATHARGACSQRAGGAQLHVAETEKYPHVTYFFNGGEEAPTPGERRELVPRRATCPPTTTSPQMSARGGGGGVRVAPGGTDGPASRSSTSPTPTWSATPA